MPKRLTDADVLELVITSTELLDQDVARLRQDSLAEASALTGWTRAHLLTHLARNADGLRNLLLAARTGAELRMYANPRARAADIEAGSSRPADVVIDDLLESDRRFLAEVAGMPSDRWVVEVAFASGQPDAPRIAAIDVLLMRLNEVAIHHVDLAAGFGFEDVPAKVAEALIDRYVRRYANRGVVADGVEGSLAERLRWLAGRGDGELLRRPAGGALPTLPNLG